MTHTAILSAVYDIAHTEKDDEGKSYLELDAEAVFETRRIITLPFMPYKGLKLAGLFDGEKSHDLFDAFEWHFDVGRNRWEGFEPSAGIFHPRTYLEEIAAHFIGWTVRELDGSSDIIVPEKFQSPWPTVLEMVGGV